MNRLLPLLACLSLGCSNVTDSGDGVVALDIKIPAVLELEVGDTIRLAARALDRNGDSVAANIVFSTPDTTIGVVAATGQITGVTPASTGRVQAAEGTLVSDFLTFSVLGRADSLALPAGGALTVGPGVTSSDPLNAQLIGAAGVSLAGHRLIYTVTAPAFADPASRTVQLSNGALVDTVLTAAEGSPISPVTLDRVGSTTAPATATVEVHSLRPAGGAIPGSGQTFTVSFQ